MNSSLRNYSAAAFAASLVFGISAAFAQTAVTETKTVTPVAPAPVVVEHTTPVAPAVVEEKTTTAPVVVEHHVAPAPTVVEHNTTTTTTTESAPTHAEKEQAKKDLKREYKAEKESIEHPDRVVK